MLASRCLATPGSLSCSRSTSLRLASCAAFAGSVAAVALPARLPVAAAAGGGGSSSGGRVGGRARKKGELPTKVCATCGLPFEYRAKWKAAWDVVKYCSDRCRRGRGGSGGGGSGTDAR
jgi:hypothetical protein